MIFSYFPPIDYQGKQTTNIFKNYRSYFDQAVSNYNVQNYYVTGSPRPEKLAEILYGNPNLYWVLLMLNKNYDPYYGWLYSQESAYQYSLQQYPEPEVAYHVNENGERFWNLIEDSSNPGVWYDKGDEAMMYPQYNGLLIPVDTLEAQTIEDEKLRNIRIIHQDDITPFMSDFIREMEKADV